MAAFGHFRVLNFSPTRAAGQVRRRTDHLLGQRRDDVFGALGARAQDDFLILDQLGHGFNQGEIATGSEPGMPRRKLTVKRG